MNVSASKLTLLRRERRQAMCLRERLAPDRDPELVLTMVQIPAGRFWMGAAPNEEGSSRNEQPQHEVTLNAFLLGQTPITQKQWREVAGWAAKEGRGWQRTLDPNPSRFKGDDQPVVNVSWFDAMEFCHRLNSRLPTNAARIYTLPSEAQWEYACRADTTTAFHFGSWLTPELANYNGTYIYANGPKGIYRNQTTSVARFPANAWGLHDMHGNVLEWCLDHWHESYHGSFEDGVAPTDGSAWLDQRDSTNDQFDGLGRLLRGGSWYDDPRFCRSSFRGRSSPADRDGKVGFRVCCIPHGLILST